MTQPSHPLPLTGIKAGTVAPVEPDRPSSQVALTPPITASILLVDDDPGSLMGMETILAGPGRRFVKAESGQDALRHLLQQDFALILLDVRMPRLDGFETAALIRQRARSRYTPIIFLSAVDTMDADVFRGLSSGAVDYLFKPVVAEVLQSKVSVFVDLFRLSEQVKQQAVQQSEERFRLFVEQVQDYAIILLDSEGLVQTWNAGAQRVTGYAAAEIIGQSMICLFTQEDRAAGKRETLLQTARTAGRVEDEGWRVRKDGSRFWANVVLTALHDEAGQLQGFANVTRDLTERKRADEEIHRLNAALEQRVLERTAQLEAANKELESFSYSVSHDLRAPLRSIDGFSLALLEDLGDKVGLQGKDYLRRVRDATQRMGQLIDDLLNLARVTREEMRREPVDLSALARSIATDLKRTQPDRQVAFAIADGLVANGDAHLLRVALENLLGNAWKFTSKRPRTRIEFGVDKQNGTPAYFVRDDGAGFDMAYSGKLFGAFQRLHSNKEFEGTGIGLATVKRVIRRHGGRVWAESSVGQGATFYFTLHLPEGNRPMGVSR
ncbi:MAG: PAS domain S-box protein [Nitrospirae bacterium]|nr:MAG: PAS domain S-box protein [Nitrospirota bacterium]